MSQPTGQRAGARSNGQRHRGQPSRQTPYSQKKPYVKGATPKEPAQTASIYKTRAFKFLVDAVGAENIALGLDSTLPRVAELANGERFTPETAFHMEMTLGLPDGFFDQPNPTLSPDTIARLKSPLDHLEDHVETVPLSQHEEQPTAVVSTAISSATDNESPEEAVMPAKKKATSAPVVAKKRVAVAPVGKAVSVTSKSRHKAMPQQSLELHDEQTMFEIRRANLHVLTARNGSKSQLGRLLEMSQSNVAHRLHGQKRMDDAESKRFTDGLGLPGGWLDVPRETGDIPETVLELLVPTGRRKPSAKSTSVAQETNTKTANESPAPTRREVRQSRSGQKDASQATNPVVTQRHDQSSKTEPSSDENVSFTPENQAIVAAETAPLTHDAYPSMSATSLETLHGIAPIAEALIKTLAGKARTGKLDESRALQLLQQAILL
jgi:hypothetical protein